MNTEKQEEINFTLPLWRRTLLRLFRVRVRYTRNVTRTLTKRPVILTCNHLSIMTRDDFCEQSGVSKTSLRQFELGKKLVRKENMNRILAFFEKRQLIFKEDGTFECS